MDISYCRELVVLADLLSFRKAADALFITQSTLSKHVATAEKELGFRIFNRSTSKVELTEAGIVYIAHLREALDSYERAVQEGLSRERDANSTVRVMGPLMNTNLAARILSASARANSAGQNLDFRVSITETGVRDCDEGLLNHHADIAIAFRYEKQSRGLLYEHLCDLPFGIACHADHPLAKKGSVRFEDLRGLRLTSYPLEGRVKYHDFVKAACTRFGVDTEIEHSIPGTLCVPDSAKSVVFGVHFPDFERYGESIVSRPLDDERMKFDVCVVRRKKEENRAVLALFDSLANGELESRKNPK